MIGSFYRAFHIPNIVVGSFITFLILSLKHVEIRFLVLRSFSAFFGSTLTTFETGVSPSFTSVPLELSGAASHSEQIIDLGF